MFFFLDTEWADPIGCELVSLALISEYGARHFYAERDPLLASPTDFVRHSWSIRSCRAARPQGRHHAMVDSQALRAAWITCHSDGGSKPYRPSI